VPDDFERVFELFDWANRESVYRIRFADGEEYEITRVSAAQDEGESPHGTATVLKSIRTRSGAPWPDRNAIFFRLEEISTVADGLTGEILYRAR
jgi:hypothetical protein